ncbi:hypothetical protein FisN_5Hu174 [Fistulifera solaris]|uniref:Uncharacterized protein n=1 Tax=Fistulifera solaris TaxID=1519565 RepID=A0A1Z5JSH3_FISSO|nr:hypothetical protein FisN_5Hu174 [Fistulifera solaris]|eukprot:GAX16802.1 hypothetical protein FisN_5Hu174 [Fistulifera solaris]
MGGVRDDSLTIFIFLNSAHFVAKFMLVLERRAFLKTLASLKSALIILPSQASADTSQNRKPATGTVEALITILQLRRTTQQILDILEENPSSARIEILLKSIPSDEKSFKSLFDAYSDPLSYKQKFVDQNAFLVYYTKGFDGPGRPSIESDLPVKQTLQYGSRNDAWVAYNDFLAEYVYQQENPADSNVQELIRPLTEMGKALDQYLSQASSQQVASALDVIQSLSR